MAALLLPDALVLVHPRASPVQCQDFQVDIFYTQLLKLLLSSRFSSYIQELLCSWQD